MYYLVTSRGPLNMAKLLEEHRNKKEKS